MLRSGHQLRRGVALAQLAGLAALATLLLGVSYSHFDHARQRSKLAQAYSELDRLTAAMEAYMIDNGGYLPSQAHSPLRTSTASAADQNLLTTPVAYVLGIPVDPFREMSQDPRLWNFAVGLTSEGYLSYIMYPHRQLTTWSLGPDRWTQAGGYRSLKSIIANEHMKQPLLGGQTPWQLGGGGTIYNGMRYDPTNGLVSVGDIYRHTELPR